MMFDDVNVENVLCVITFITCVSVSYTR